MKKTRISLHHKEKAVSLDTSIPAQQTDGLAAIRSLEVPNQEQDVYKLFIYMSSFL